MRRTCLPQIVGLLSGVLLAAAIADFTRQPNRAAPADAILSECDGTIRQIAIQYVGGMDFVRPTYRAFFAALPAEVKIVLICPGPADRDELLSAIGKPASRFTAVFTSHAMTTWSRDRWITLTPATQGDPIPLIAPREEAGADAWPERQGDERLAGNLAANLPGITARRSRLAFDGGDFLANGSTVFVSPAVLERNLYRGAESEKELLDELNLMLGRKKIVLLRNAPPHHIGMYMAIVGEGQAIVGDPSLGRPLFTASSLITPDELPATQKQFDDVAEQVRAAGYRVQRIPTVVAADGKTYLTFVNGLIDQRAGRRTFYLPTYRGQDALNAAAAEVWKNAGCIVQPVDCSNAFPHFGTLHCLVNVLNRS